MSAQTSEKTGKQSKKPKTIVGMAKKHLRKHFKRNIPIAYKFHQYSRFLEIVKDAKKIAIEAGVEGEDLEIILLATWFMHSGITEMYENYHQISIDNAEKFLADKGYPAEKIERVKSLILKASPLEAISGKSAEIIHDARMAYMGKKKFSRYSNSLRVELEEVFDKKIKNREWADDQYNQLINAHFFTDYANEKYQDRLADNIQSQRKVIEKAKTAAIRVKTGKEFGRGIDTLYRTSYRNHINLSSIADGKANMMISINTIILSAIVTLMAAGMSFSGNVSFNHFRYIIPILILLVSVLISAVFAVLSARPKITENEEISEEDILTREKSVLFFGNFIHMERGDFIKSLDMLKKNQSLLYDNMAVDMYYLGHVLDKKYKLLKHSYNVFMTGLILCVVVFIFLLFYTRSQGVDLTVG